MSKLSQKCGKTFVESKCQTLFEIKFFETLENYESRKISNLSKK